MRGLSPFDEYVAGRWLIQHGLAPDAMDYGMLAGQRDTTAVEILGDDPWKRSMSA